MEQQCLGLRDGELLSCYSEKHKDMIPDLKIAPLSVLCCLNFLMLYVSWHFVFLYFSLFCFSLFLLSVWLISSSFYPCLVFLVLFLTSVFLSDLYLTDCVNLFLVPCEIVQYCSFPQPCLLYWVLFFQSC